MRKDDNFGFLVPLAVEDINQNILTPRNTWQNPEDYDKQAKKLVSMFINNFAQYENFVGPSVLAQAIKNN